MTAQTQPSTAFDAFRAADFENRFVIALNEGAMLQLISLAHRSGLLTQLADGEPVTSSELAAKARLDERYVREWLGGATVAALVEHDPQAMTYRLPPEHAALLTDGGEANLAVFSQYLPLMGQVEDDVLECFHHGGGVPYTRYARFHEVMAEDSGQTVLPVLLDAILPLAPELPARLAQGIDVLDLGLANLRFEERDLSDFDLTAPAQHYDLVTTFDAIHDQAHPLNLLKGIRRTLRENGVYLAQDIHSSSHHHGDREHPMGTLLYTLSIMHCMSVSLAQGGEGLGTMWGQEKAREYFAKAGFGNIEVHQLPHDIQNDYWVLRP